MNEYKKIVQETLTERDLLEQLAEEAAELSQAALKLIRASGMNKNATPVTREQAAENVLEELRDVLIAAEALGIWLGDHKMDSYKWQRWADRLMGKVVKSKPVTEVVKRGYWFIFPDDIDMCSECGFKHEFALALFKYCPKCGAKMDCTLEEIANRPPKNKDFDAIEEK